MVLQILIYLYGRHYPPCETFHKLLIQNTNKYKKDYSKYLNKNSIKLINTIYKYNFKLFNYKMINVEENVILCIT